MDNQNWTSLIDFSKLKNNMISGLEGKDVEKEAQKSIGVINVAEKDTYPDLPDEVEKEIEKCNQILKNKKTEEQTDHYAKLFKSFLSENNLPANLENMPMSTLNRYLRFFYYKIRTKQGTLYSPSTLLCMRSAINRHLNGFENIKVNLTSDEFESSNVMLKTMIGKYLIEGGKMKKYIPIEETDMKKIGEYFDRKNPLTLQDEIIFNFIYFLGQRGREHIRAIKKEDIDICRDAVGKEYLTIKRGLISKNVKGSLKNNEFMDIKQAKIFEADENCPVAAYKLYISKLPPNCQNLFPKPLQNFHGDQWYSAYQVRGKDYLGNLLKKLSQQLNLSQEYTNHCVRSTVVSTMINEGYDTLDISAITGHKSDEALRKYASVKRHSQLQKYSTTLHSALHPSANKNSLPQKQKAYQNEKLIKDNELPSTSYNYDNNTNI